MPWGWQGRGTATTSARDAAHAWPSYELDYLATRLREKQSDNTKWDLKRFKDSTALQSVYLNEVIAGYKGEADECLKHEFDLWLQGKHETNVLQDEINKGAKDVSEGYYKPHDNASRRRHTYRTGQMLSEGRGVGDEMVIDGNGRQAWRDTAWGTAALTHLPGVREHLRDAYVKKRAREAQLNILAEHGPQNLEEAWLYFKHWVKQMPVSDAECKNVTEKSLQVQPRPTIGNLTNHIVDYVPAIPNFKDQQADLPTSSESSFKQKMENTATAPKAQQASSKQETTATTPTAPPTVEENDGDTPQTWLSTGAKAATAAGDAAKLVGDAAVSTASASASFIKGAAKVVNNVAGAADNLVGLFTGTGNPPEDDEEEEAERTLALQTNGGTQRIALDETLKNALNNPKVSDASLRIMLTGKKRGLDPAAAEALIANRRAQIEANNTATLLLENRPSNPTNVVKSEVLRIEEKQKKPPVEVRRSPRIAAQNNKK